MGGAAILSTGALRNRNRAEISHGLRLQGDTLNSAIVQCSVTAPYLVPLLRAARDDIASVRHLMRGAKLNPRKLARTREPAILLLDDCEPHTTGPRGWRGIRHAREWPANSWVMGSGADAGHAAQAVELVQWCRRLLVIRTTDEHAAAWAAWLGSTGAVPIAQWSTALPVGRGETLQ
jgi:hypothetical protein